MTPKSPSFHGLRFDRFRDALSTDALLGSPVAAALCRSDFLGAGVLLTGDGKSGKAAAIRALAASLDAPDHPRTTRSDDLNNHGQETP